MGDVCSNAVFAEVNGLVNRGCLFSLPFKH
jgi:hypothetical protein